MGVNRLRSGRRLLPSEQARLDHQNGLPIDEPRSPLSTDQPRPKAWDTAAGVPVDWQRSTMAHLCSVYPFHADAGFGDRGALMGADITGGLSGFYFDPFEFYNAGRLSNPNMIVMGSVGFGKSATVKALVRRLRAVYGRSSIQRASTAPSRATLGWRWSGSTPAERIE
jgi:Cdc6-like AAA superfamily ATPase